MWQSKYTADFKLMKSLTKVCQRCQRLSLTGADTAFTMAGDRAHRWPLTMRLGGWRLVLAATSYGIYLLHQPPLIYANQYLTGPFRPGARFAVLLLGIGWLCYRAAVGLNLLVYRLARP